jgi:hypothetical protein
MGQALSSTNNDWPWVWAIRDVEVLDWRNSPGVRMLVVSCILLTARSADGPLEAHEIQRLSQTQQDLPVEISPYLYLSDARHAHDIERLKARGITHVLNVAGSSAVGPADAYAAEGVTVLNIAAEDEEGYPMLAMHLDRSRAFIAAARGYVVAAW